MHTTRTEAAERLTRAERLTFDVSVAGRARGRLTRRLMPLLVCLFVIAFLDRVNAGYAALASACLILCVSHSSNAVEG